jgi:hypothetical protein
MPARDTDLESLRAVASAAVDELATLLTSDDDGRR